MAGTFFMEFLDGTILTTAIPNISTDLAVPAADVIITMTAYLLTVAVGIPISGWLVERFGARHVFCLAIAVFTLASLACSLSQNLTTLTLRRIAQAAAGAMMVPVGTLVVLRGTRRSELLRTTAFLVWPAGLRPSRGRRAHHVPVLALDLPDNPPPWRCCFHCRAAAGPYIDGRPGTAARLAEPAPHQPWE